MRGAEPVEQAQPARSIWTNAPQRAIYVWISLEERPVVAPNSVWDTWRPVDCRCRNGTEW